MNYDIITFGSATLDIFVGTDDFLIKPEKGFTTQKGVCFPFGSKADIKGLDFRTGGGGTNAAATFGLQGLKVAFCGKIGEDFAGKEILKDLERFKISKSLVIESREKATNLSIIFYFAKDRTCFVWRGASELLKENEIPWKKLETKWVYLAPFSGKLSALFGPIVDFAKRHKIKVFANPGSSQIGFSQKPLKSVLQKIDVLLLNQEEASLLTKIPYQKEKKVFEKLDELCPGIAIMTKGAQGAVVSDGNYIWEAKASNVPVLEKTGAGDAFGSGFLAGLIKTKEILPALQLGMANSASCIQRIGAKEGLLKKEDSWGKIKVLKKKIK